MRPRNNQQMEGPARSERFGGVAREKMAVAEQGGDQDPRSRMSEAAERNGDRAGADSIKQMKSRAAIAGSQILDQQRAFNHPRRVEPAMFEHLVEIGRAGVAVTSPVAQIAENSHARAIIERQPVVIVTGLVVPERRDDLRDARRGALSTQRRDLLDGDAQVDSIG